MTLAFFWDVCVQVQEHEFNMPYQIASPRFLPISNQPEEAQQYEVAVQVRCPRGVDQYQQQYRITASLRAVER